MSCKVFNICDSPLAFYFQRQSETINDFYGSKNWRYYYDNLSIPGSQHFVDLTNSSSRDEVMSVLEAADVLLFHATRNYRRPLICRDGLIEASDYPMGKTEIVLIHGHPETQNIDKTNQFIERYRQKIRFFVATPNQLNLFKGVNLLPIVAQFTAENKRYQPQADYLRVRQPVKIIRRNDWKASEVASLALEEIGAHNELLKARIKRLFSHLTHSLRGTGLSPLVPKKIIQKSISGFSVLFDNRVFWHDIYDVLNDLRASDILLENNWNDYPGGGCNHTIGVEAMSMGVTCFNGMTLQNSLKLAEWLGADHLPPLPNWENEEHYRRESRRYLQKVIFDDDFRCELKRRSRQYFVDWYDAPNVVPKVVSQILSI